LFFFSHIAKIISDRLTKTQFWCTFFQFQPVHPARILGQTAPKRFGATWARAKELVVEPIEEVALRRQFDEAQCQALSDPAKAVIARLSCR
jgi:hypothetical protein